MGKYYNKHIWAVEFQQAFGFSYSLLLAADLSFYLQYRLIKGTPDEFIHYWVFGPFSIFLIFYDFVLIDFIYSPEKNQSNSKKGLYTGDYFDWTEWEPDFNFFISYWISRLLESFNYISCH